MTTREFEHRTILRLRRLVLRLRGYLLLDGLAVLFVVAAGAAALQLLLDWLLRLAVDMRAALLGTVLLVIAVVGWRRVVVPQRARLGVAEAAMLVERRHPQLRSLLISAVRFGRGDVGATDSNSPELMRAVLDRAASAMTSLDLHTVLRHTRARRSTAVALGVVAAFTLAFVAAPETMGIWFDRSVLLGDTPWPKKTRLIVLDLPDGVLRGARGDDLEVRALVPEGYDAPRLVEISYTFSSGKTSRDRMTRVGPRGYRYTFARAVEDFEFHLEGGDDRTDVFRAELTDRPRVESASILVTPPAYTRRRPYTLADERRSVAVLPGSELSLRVETNHPVRQAVLTAGQEPIAAAVPDASGWTVTLRPLQSRTYHFALLDDAGLENRRPLRFAVRMLQDKPPRVRMKLPGVGSLVTTEAVLPLELNITDDYGLAAAELVCSIERHAGEERIIALPAFRPGGKQHSERIEQAIASLPVVANDRITLYARASDFDDVSGPNVAVSSAVSLRVVSREELLAELARREQDYRRDFERAVDRQEDLRRGLLTTLERLTRPASRDDALRAVGSAERLQRQLGGQVNAVRQQFEQIMTQMEINRVADSSSRRRLGDGVVAPLTQLAKRDLPEAADALRRLARDLTPERMSPIDPQQAALLSAMRETLANMLKWEGFQETVSMLRDILRLQRELNKETAQELEQQAEDIFEEE